MRLLPRLLVLCSCIPLLFAAETAPVTTIMAQLGKQLLHDDFNRADLKPNWGTNKGEYQIVDGQLRVAEREADKHHAAASWKNSVTDVVVQFRFRLDNSKWMGLSFSDKEHVARIYIYQNHIDIAKMQGMGPTTKKTLLNSIKIDLQPDAWHTARLEIVGNEFLAQIDDLAPMYGSAEGINVSKGRVALISGTQYAWYDDIQVWEATLHPEWEARKAQVVKK